MASQAPPIPINNTINGGGSRSLPGSPARPVQQRMPNGTSPAPPAAPSGPGVSVAGPSRGGVPLPIMTGLSRQYSGISTPLQSSSRPIPSSSLPSLPIGRSAPSPGRMTPAPSAANTPLPFPGQVDAVAGPSSPPPPSLDKEAASRKRKWETQGYTQEEQEYLEQRSNELHLSLLLDQEETLHSSAARFTSYENMVDRLLPWHVWQIHDEELEVGLKVQGARGVLAEEKEKADAGVLVGRIKRIHERFASARRREGNPNRRSFDILSLIKMTKDSADSARIALAPDQARLQGLEAANRVQQEIQRKADVERRRVLDEEERRRTKAADEARKAREAQAAKEAKEAAEAKIAKAAKEKADAAALAAAAAKRVAAANAAATAAATPSGKSKAAAAAETPGSAKGTPARGRGRPRGRGGRGGASLRETVLTQQSTGIPATPTPTTPTIAAKKIVPPAAPSPGPNGISTPAAGPSTPRINSPSKSSITNDSPSKAVANGSSAKAVPPRAIPQIPTSTTPTTSTPPMKSPITLAIKLIVLPQLIRLGLLAMPGGAATDKASAAPHPATIKGPVPNSPTGDVYLQVQLNLCSAQQLQGLAKALNIPVPDPAQRPVGAPGSASHPGSPAPLAPSSSVNTAAPSPVAGVVPNTAPAPIPPAVAGDKTGI